MLIISTLVISTQHHSGRVLAQYQLRREDLCMQTGQTAKYCMNLINLTGTPERSSKEVLLALCGGVNL